MPLDKPKHAFSLPKLPYAEDALDPVISAKTISFHHGKHHAAYVNNLNGLIGGTSYDGMALEADHEDQLQDQTSRRGHRPSRLLHGKCNRKLGRARQLERQATSKAATDQYGLPARATSLI